MVNIIDTNLQFNSNITKRSLEKIKRIILHHSGVTVLQTVETIHNYHKNTNGWAGIGYHFYVRKDGSIYKGRDVEFVGAHASGSNSDSIGICFEGNFNEETMNDAQKQAGKELVAYLKNKYNINTVQAHRDVCATSCPGDKFPFDEIANSKIDNVEEPAQQDEVKQPDIFNDGKVNCIYDIQEWLRNKYGYNLSLDNLYGPETKKYLVMALQHELNVQFGAGLSEDGIFGTNTYNACITVRQGAEGNITMLIQMALFIKGYTLDMDKIFGENTARVLKQFQADNGLVVDAICGKNTFKKLFE